MRIKRDVPDVSRIETLAAAECRYCGDLIGPFEVDHVVPLSRGGTNKLDNLACACVSCNTQKSNFHLHEWIQWRQANGMSWPPAAQHSTEACHYPDYCRPCWDRLGHEGLGKRVITKAYRLSFNGRGYVCYYECQCGNQWTCSYALGTWWYTDCDCTFCVAMRKGARS